LRRSFLIVDAAQSIQAQTISNLYLALENDLTIIPILNKIDLPSANPEEVTDEIMNLIGCEYEDVLRVSGKQEKVFIILEQIVERIPAPVGDPDAPLQALIFDSVYNPFRGIEAYFKVVNGSISKMKNQIFATGKEYGADEVGTLKLKQVPKKH
jgi:GTP-binding protein LepA